jgi:hypothetical protein
MAHMQSPQVLFLPQNVVNEHVPSETDVHTLQASRQNGKLAGNEGSENHRRGNATDEPALHDDLGSGDNDTSKIDHPPAVCGKAVLV